MMDNSTAQQLLEITVRLDTGGGGGEGREWKGGRGERVEGRGERVEVRGERVEGRVYVPQTDGCQTEHVTCDGQLHSSTVTGDHCQVRHGGGGRGERVEGRGERVEGRVYVPQTDGRQTEHVICDGQLHSSTVTGDHCQVRHRGVGEGRDWKGEGREWKGEGREWKGESTFLRQMVARLSTLHVMDNSTAQQLLEITVRLDTGGGERGESGRERGEWKGESPFLRQTVDRLSTLHVMDNSTAQQLLEITVRLDTGGGEGREWKGEGRVEGRVSVPQTDGRQTEHVTCDGQLHSSTVTGDHCQVRHWGEGGRGEKVEGRGESGRESLRSSDRRSTD